MSATRQMDQELYSLLTKVALKNEQVDINSIEELLKKRVWPTGGNPFDLLLSVGFDEFDPTRVDHARLCQALGLLLQYEYQNRIPKSALLIAFPLKDCLAYLEKDISDNENTKRTYIVKAKVAMMFELDTLLRGCNQPVINVRGIERELMRFGLMSEKAKQVKEAKNAKLEPNKITGLQKVLKGEVDIDTASMFGAYYLLQPKLKPIFEAMLTIDKYKSQFKKESKKF